MKSLAKQLFLILALAAYCCGQMVGTVRGYVCACGPELVMASSSECSELGHEHEHEHHENGHEHEDEKLPDHKEWREAAKSTLLSPKIKIPDCSQALPAHFLVDLSLGVRVPPRSHDECVRAWRPGFSSPPGLWHVQRSMVLII